MAFRVGPAEPGLMEATPLQLVGNAAKSGYL